VTGRSVRYVTAGACRTSTTVVLGVLAVARARGIAGIRGIAGAPGDRRGVPRRRRTCRA